MANVIANVTVPAPVIQFNNTYYLKNGQYNPRTLNVPCGVNAEVDDEQWWMTPVKDFGIVSILQAIPAIGENVNQPTPDSISVIRIRDKYQPYYVWYAACTLAQYYAACGACCGTVVAIPAPTLPVIVPCQQVCDAQDANGNYFVTFVASDLGAGQHYIVDGIIDNSALSEFTATSLSDLLTQLNSHYNSIGSPAVSVVWTRNGNVFTGTFQNGLGGSSEMCLEIQLSP